MYLPQRRAQPGRRPVLLAAVVVLAAIALLVTALGLSGRMGGSMSALRALRIDGNIVGQSEVLLVRAIKDQAEEAKKRADAYRKSLVDAEADLTQLERENHRLRNVIFSDKQGREKFSELLVQLRGELELLDKADNNNPSAGDATNGNATAVNASPNRLANSRPPRSGKGNNQSSAGVEREGAAVIGMSVAHQRKRQRLLRMVDAVKQALVTTAAPPTDPPRTYRPLSWKVPDVTCAKLDWHANKEFKAGAEDTGGANNKLLPYNYTHWQEVKFECIADWRAPLPNFLDDGDYSKWRELDRPFFGCDISPANHTCLYKGDCSTYHIVHNSSVSQDALQLCGIRESRTQFVVNRGKNCDARTFVPMRVPEGAYFGHLDNLMTKLIRPLLHGETNILMYIDASQFVSGTVVDMLRRMGVELTHDFPKGCFRRVIWACHTLSFDPITAVAINQQLLQTYARVSREPQKPTNCQRYYVSRWGAPDARNGRKMPNEEAFVGFLRDKLGFCILFGNETMDQWAVAMRHARVFMGAHGGALTHQFWLDPANKPVVIELDGYKKHAQYWLHAVSMGFTYGWMSFNQSYGVDFDRTTRFLTKLGVI